jgi:hypothetical protein
MTKSPSAPSATPIDDAPAFPLDVLRMRADRLARAAKEACRQHLRCSALCDRPDVDVAELNGILELAGVADRLLGEAAEAYAKAGAKLHPDGEDAGWWKQANALWLAAREHVRRHTLGDRMSKRAGSAPSRERLSELHVEYELEASAILSLQQVADAYCRARPTAE